MIYACPHTSSAINVVAVPAVQNTTFRNPSWKTASAMMPRANSQNMGYLRDHHICITGQRL
jgi:hypothetical protein